MRLEAEELKDFRCMRCGNCCRWSGYVRLNDGEIALLSAELGISELEFTDKYTMLTADRRNLSLIEKDDGSCIFFSEEPSRCVIEKVKPRQCRDFPFAWNCENWEEECAGAQELLKKR